MSLEEKSLRCSKCGHKWRGFWDWKSTAQCGEAKRCPSCGKEAAQSLQSIDLFTENACQVTHEDGVVRFVLPPLQPNVDAPYATLFCLPRHAAMNLAAFLAIEADPEGKDFGWLLEEAREKYKTITSNLMK